jgi:hypothetical protein
MFLPPVEIQIAVTFYSNVLKITALFLAEDHFHYGCFMLNHYSAKGYLFVSVLL